MQDYIEIQGAEENNLKNISLSIPKNKLVVFTGVSGSGKSSLVFDTIAVESMRQMGEMLPPYVRNRMPRHEAPKVQKIDYLSPAIVIEQRPFSGDIRSTVGTMINVAPMLRLLFSRCAEPRLASSSAYSFNDPQGMCPECGGLGKTVTFDFNKLFDCSKSLNEGAILFPGHQIGTYQWQLYANADFLNPDKKLCDYSEKEWQDFLHGSGTTVLIQNKTGKVWSDYQLTYEGFLDRITRLYLKREINRNNKTNARILQDFTVECNCPKCCGMRISAAAQASRLHGKNIAEVGELESSDCIMWLSQITDPVGKPIAENIQRVLSSMEEIGLGYLTLNRPSKSLSGGEAQRLKIIRHLGSSLTGLTYIFDEPSAGLHPQNITGLLSLLLHLRDRGNTILVVEHNPQIIQHADYIFEMGPQAGKDGGKILFQGTPEELKKTDTPTGRSLWGRKEVLHTPRKERDWITLSQVKVNNLKNITVHIPRGALTVVSGPAGAGKSSLICGGLRKQYPDAIHIDQKPIGTTARSNPATYVGIMSDIRKLFAKENQVDAGWFSYNSVGACPACQGKGEIKTELAFMDPVTVMCEQCRGQRYSQQALQYRYHGKSILDIMNMTIEEAIEFFDLPKIRQRLQTLCDVGMGYMTLGHPTSMLSGGECQRIKLASYLKGKRGMYILDEPTVGLHYEDIQRLMQVLNRMVDNGNTVVVMEHNTEVIRQADWNIDLGPGGGKYGGELIVEGRLDQLMACPNSVTAKFLRKEMI